MAIFNFVARKSPCLKRDAPGRKTKSLEANRNGTVKADGVFVSSRTLAMRPLSPPSSSVSVSSNESSGTNASTVTTTPPPLPASPATSWKSAGTKEHNLNSPLVVTNPDDTTERIVDEATHLGKILARSRHLPGTWYYSSNHILVNQERTRRTMAPLIRMVELDLLARLHAEQMAEEDELRHVEADALRYALQDIPYRRLGENVAKGSNVRSIHTDMMSTLSNRNNIVDRRFTHFGMGTAVANNGELYLCQIFRGWTINEVYKSIFLNTTWSSYFIKQLGATKEKACTCIFSGLFCYWLWEPLLERLHNDIFAKSIEAHR